MRKINIQKDVESRKKISQSIPAIVSYDTMEETKTAEPRYKPEKENEDAQSETIQEPEADPIPGQPETAKKGGRKAKGNL